MAEIIENIIKITLVGIFAVFVYSVVLEKRYFLQVKIPKERIVVLCVVTALFVSLRILEAVLFRETAVVDRFILLTIRENLSPYLVFFFAKFTDTGSLVSTSILASVTTSFLLLRKHFWEASLLGVSHILAWIITFTLKMLIPRPRPQLWPTLSYWGNSFPSGHTLASACLTSAAVICVSRLRPQRTGIVLLWGSVWSGLVAFSRLALGVHWPSDVVAALCIGAALPYVLDAVMAKIFAKMKSLKKKS